MQPHSGSFSKQTSAIAHLRHKAGLIFFWVLNDRLDWAAIDRQIAGFAAAGVSALCIHPRSGLLIPYGGDEWFEVVREICERCERAGLDVWLYDEDPFPSGSAGGRVTAERPDLIAQRVVRHEYTAAPDDEGLFVFPVGRLLWCGLIDENGECIPGADLTSRVGMIRRKWVVLDPWDSRYYYPDTPRHSCPRAWTAGEEYAVSVPTIPAGTRLVAFRAEQVQGQDDSHHWTCLPDRLNPEAAGVFIEWTHEKYKAIVGDRFGKQIRAMFTDEPSFSFAVPWTRGLFDDFKRAYNYDLRTNLDHLFSDRTSPQAMRTRIDFRTWCNRRYKTVWLEPIAAWCRANDLDLVGHMSPEDDPIQQVNLIGDSLPLMRGLTFPGFDLIIPAVGDSEHPLLNIGIISATSVQQQQNRAGVLTETLGCAGRTVDGETARRILAWQTLMGVSVPVLHAAYISMRDQRAIDAPPDVSPDAAVWPEIVSIQRELMPIQEHIRGAKQIAPVAVLWPIRSFQALNLDWQNDTSGMRRGLANLLLELLDHQVGVQIIDESSLASAAFDSTGLSVGLSRYKHLLVPPSLVYHEQTFERVEHLQKQGFDVRWISQVPQWVQSGSGVRPWKAPSQLRVESAAAVASRLPRLVEIDGPRKNVRCTSWVRDNRRVNLLIDLANSQQLRTINGVPTTLSWDKVTVIEN